ncbi:response regulator transcription factor [Acidaminobacter sp. JC074]|uniref:response regulator transcription factor n=1 Tax=Acidaminobacter sp. JC074 TaxID=2530199 RepID=UPI001F0E50EC|nr:response regulator transcription factor [Acidaminobacter sp. JC074]MCH4890760.1 response regulator transcription factor [Acidaminobacter sp. JC074]
MKHILVVDDEKNIRDLIEKYLVASNYKVTTYGDAKYLVEEVRRLSPDLIVLDIMMPNSNGLDVCKEIRKFSEIPIIFVSAKDEEFDRILGLELGADDYLSKPFSPRELVVRVKNIFRRLNNKPKEDLIKIKDILIDKERRSIRVLDQTLKTTQKEYELMVYMAENANHSLSRDQMIEEVWGYDFDGDTRVVDDLVKRLRKKLTSLDSSLTIETVWGFGYKIET